MSKTTQDDMNNESVAKETPSLIGQLIDIQTGSFPHNIINIGKTAIKVDQGGVEKETQKVMKHKQRKKHKASNKKNKARQVTSQH